MWYLIFLASIVHLPILSWVMGGVEAEPFLERLSRRELALSLGGGESFQVEPENFLYKKQWIRILSKKKMIPIVIFTISHFLSPEITNF